MRPTFYQASLQDVRLPPQPPVTIRDEAAPVPPPAVRGTPRGCERPYCGPEQNSRIAFAFSRKTTAVAWKVPIPSGFRAEFVLASADRIVLDLRRAWLLLDHAGKVVQQEARAAGDIVADSNLGLLYAPTESGYLAAYNLSEGKRTFLLSLYFANDFLRSFILPLGRRLLVASVERQNDPHGKREPNMAVVELHEFSMPFELSDAGRLKSERRVNDIKRRTATLKVAARGDTVALATDNAVYLADTDLKLQTELTSEFEPLHLSLDELSRIHMTVRRTGGEAEYWTLTPSGQRTARVPLPSEFTPTEPPIIAFDRSVYLIDSSRVLAIDPSTQRIRWDRMLGSVAGAVTDADNALLVSAGNAIVGISTSGEPHVVFRAEGDVLTSPPSVTPSGDLIVAGERFLYLLR